MKIRQCRRENVSCYAVDNADFGFLTSKCYNIVVTVNIYFCMFVVLYLQENES